MEDSSQIGSYVMSVITGPTEVVFNGKLEGVAKIESAALVGERRALVEHKPSSRKHRSHSVTSSQVVSLWAAQLSAPQISMEYNLARINLH